ncbi:MAG: hypothetical protein CMF51_01850 [Legionellales bacterium]|nr:hypothetical protein [Legionellales bacterium]
MFRGFLSRWLGMRSSYQSYFEVLSHLKKRLDSIQSIDPEELIAHLRQPLHLEDLNSDDRIEVVQSWIADQAHFNQRLECFNQLKQHVSHINAEDLKRIKLFDSYGVLSVVELMEPFHQLNLLKCELDRIHSKIDQMESDQSGNYEKQLSLCLNLTKRCCHLQGRFKSMIKYDLIFGIQSGFDQYRFNPLIYLLNQDLHTCKLSLTAECYLSLISRLSQYEDLNQFVQLESLALIHRPLFPDSFLLLPKRMIDHIPKVRAHWLSFILGRSFFDCFFKNSLSLFKLWSLVIQVRHLNVKQTINHQCQVYQEAIDALNHEKIRVQTAMNQLWFFQWSTRAWLNQYYQSIITHQFDIYQHLVKMLKYQLNGSANHQIIQACDPLFDRLDQLTFDNAQLETTRLHQSILLLRHQYDECLALQCLSGVLSAGRVSYDLIEGLNRYVCHEFMGSTRSIHQAIKYLTQYILSPDTVKDVKLLETSIDVVMQCASFKSECIQSSQVEYLKLHVSRAVSLKKGLLYVNDSFENVQLPLSIKRFLLDYYPSLSERVYTEQIQLEGSILEDDLNAWIEVHPFKATQKMQHLAWNQPIDIQWRIWKNCQANRPYLAQLLHEQWCMCWSQGLVLGLNLDQFDSIYYQVGNWLFHQVDSSIWINSIRTLNEGLIEHYLSQHWDDELFQLTQLFEPSSRAHFARLAVQSLFLRHQMVECFDLNHSIVQVLGASDAACSIIHSSLNQVLEHPESLRNELIFKLCEHLMNDTLSNKVYLNDFQSTPDIRKLMELKSQTDACTLKIHQLSCMEDSSAYLDWIDSCERVVTGYISIHFNESQVFLNHMSTLFHEHMHTQLMAHQSCQVEYLSELDQSILKLIDARKDRSRWHEMIHPWRTICLYKSYLSTSNHHILNAVIRFDFKDDSWINLYSITIIRMNLISEKTLNSIRVHLDWLLYQNLNESDRLMIHAFRSFILNPQLARSCPEILTNRLSMLDSGAAPWSELSDSGADSSCSELTHLEQLKQMQCVFESCQVSLGFESFLVQLEQLSLMRFSLKYMLPWMNEGHLSQAHDLLFKVDEWISKHSNRVEPSVVSCVDHHSSCSMSSIRRV